jgi:hypothetical protein
VPVAEGDVDRPQVMRQSPDAALVAVRANMVAHLTS